jgi:hypothetical protein
MLPDARASARSWWDKVAWAVWLAALAAVVGRVLWTTDAWQSVYPVYHLAGQNWRAGNSLYVLPEDTAGKHWYRYSPAVAALMAPLSLFPERVGSVLWRLLIVAVYLGGCAWWIRRIMPQPPGPGQIGTFFLLIAPLSLGSLNLGQANVLVIGLLLATMAAICERRWPLAAGCSAVAGFFKLYPLALALLLGILYPRRFLPWLVVAVALGLALPFAVQQPDYVVNTYHDWFRALQQVNYVEWFSHPPKRDLRLLLRVSGFELSHTAYMAIQLAGAVGCAALCTALRRLAWPEQRLRLFTFALATCWMVLLGPGIESCTYILIAPPLAWLLLDSFREPAAAVDRALLLGSYGLLLATTVATWFPHGAEIVHGRAVHPVAALLLLAALLLREFRWFNHSRSEQSLALDGAVAVRAA